MYTFTSIHNRYTIFGKPVGDTLEYQVQFSPVGNMGTFTTTDESLVEKLRKHPDFNKKFVEIGIRGKESSNLVSGTRSSETHPELGKEKFDPQKLIEFGRLQATLLKNDKTYRKDASEEDKLKYEAFKKELGELE